MDDRRFKVGELAAIAGLTVRTLHHWDEIGLLHASERSGGGYRLYGEDDVRRLYRILALRSLGLPLSEIEAALAGDIDVRSVVERQLGELDRRIALEEQLRKRLVQVLEAPEGADLIETIEVMTMIEDYYTKEQLETLAERREELGPEGMAKGQRDWADLLAEFEAEHDAGTDPADPKVQALVARADELIGAFTGGDPEMRASLDRMYAEQGAETASQGWVKPELMEYMGRARSCGS